MCKGNTVYRSGSRGNEPLVPLSVEDALTHLESQGILIGSAMSDCMSGICDV